MADERPGRRVLGHHALPALERGAGTADACHGCSSTLSKRLGPMRTLQSITQVVLGSPLALSPFGALLQSVGEASPFALEIATALPLLYLSICTYRSLFKFKLFGDFSLQVKGSPSMCILLVPGSDPLVPPYHRARDRACPGPSSSTPSISSACRSGGVL
jgi:hypothetical protein